jgi:hypothetical protein
MSAKQYNDQSFNPFIQIDVRVWDSLDLYETRLYGHIKRRAGQNSSCWESLENMAAHTGIGRSKLITTIQSLVDRGFLKKKKSEVGRTDTYLLTPSKYWVLKPNPSTKRTKPVHETNTYPSTKRTPTRPRNEHKVDPCEVDPCEVDPITHTDPDCVCENFEPEILPPDPEPCQPPIIPPSPAKESASTNNPSSEEDLPPPVTNISEVVNTPDCDLSSVARFDRTLRTYQPTEDLTAQLVETYNKVKPDHWGKCSQIGVHMPRQVAGLVRRYESPELVAQEWGEACLALKANEFYNSPKFQSGNINFLLDPSKPDRIPQLAQAWRDRPQQQKEQLAHKMVAKANGIPRWENPDVVLTGAMLHLRRDRYARYVTREDFDNPDCPSIDYLQTYFPELFIKNA